MTRSGHRPAWLRSSFSLYIKVFVCTDTMPSSETRDGHEAAGIFGALSGAAASANLWPLVARAQQAIPVVGYLSASSAGDNVRLSAFRLGLEEQGFVEGRNVIVEYGHAKGKYDRLAAMAAGFANTPVAVIMASALPSALAAQKATAKIP